MATDSDPMSTDSDLISSLPDDILHRILGFMNTKRAVQTCVLSKRWEHLWTFLPSLDLNGDDFQSDVDDDEGEDGSVKFINNHDFDSDSDSDDANEKDGSGSAKFMNFVNKLLQKRKSLDLDMFFLSGNDSGSYSDEYDNHIREWISYAVKTNLVKYIVDNFH